MIYLKTMNNLSHRKKFWKHRDIAGTKNTFILYYFILHSLTATTRAYSAGHDSIIGEYINVAVLMCQQYMDQFPDFYSELEKHYLVSILLCVISLLLPNNSTSSLWRTCGNGMYWVKWLLASLLNLFCVIKEMSSPFLMVCYLCFLHWYVQVYNCSRCMIMLCLSL